MSIEILVIAQLLNLEQQLNRNKFIDIGKAVGEAHGVPDETVQRRTTF